MKTVFKNLTDLYYQLSPRDRVGFGVVGGVLLVSMVAVVSLSFDSVRGSTPTKKEMASTKVKGVKTEEKKDPTPTPAVLGAKITPTKKIAILPTPTKIPASNSPTPTQSQQTATPTPTQSQSTHVEIGHLPTIGEANAKVVVVEFTDFQCPYCKIFLDNTFGKIKDDYIQTGKVRFAVRHFPLSGHTNAQKAGEAVECANEKGKFWDYHNTLFAKQSDWASKSQSDVVNAFADYANDMGMNREEFKICVESGKFASAVTSDLSYGQSKSVSGTPTSFINLQQITGAVDYSEFKSAIEQELAK